MNLRFSRRGDYVLRSAIRLARAYDATEPTKLREISAEMDVPRSFVSQILGDLLRAGLAVSSLGAHGGYRLARSPETISLLEVIEAGEGPLVSDRCALGQGPCYWQEVCPLHETWVTATSALRGVLSSTCLAELSERDHALSICSYQVHIDEDRLQVLARVLESRRRPGRPWPACHHWKDSARDADARAPLESAAGKR
ncbi:MAG: RrF2 family transcriptional regulator [Acidimicrobiales bacterium]